MVDALGVSFEERRVPLRLNYSKYGGLLTEDNLIRLAALLIDYSTVKPTLAVRNIVLENPEIKVRVSPVRAATEAFFFALLLRAECWFFCTDHWGTKGETQDGCRDHAEEPSAGNAGGLLLQHRGRQPHGGKRHLREV